MINHKIFCKLAKGICGIQRFIMRAVLFSKALGYTPHVTDSDQCSFISNARVYPGFVLTRSSTQHVQLYTVSQKKQET